MNNELQELLQKNNVDQDRFETELYNVLVLSTFATLVKEIDEAEAWDNVRERYRTFPDHIHVTKLLITKYVGGHFHEREYEKFYRLMEAHLRKKGQRKPYPESIRESLVEKQNRRCNICGRAISSSSSELDHVIPWSLVGDELEDNLQMLCKTCNRRKSATVTYALLSTFFDRSDQ